MNNWKIGTKLTMGFGILALLILGTGGIGYFGIEKLHYDLEEIEQTELPGVVLLGEMNFERMVIRGQTLEVWIYENIPDSQRDFENIIAQRNASWAAFEKDFGEFGALHRINELEQQLWNRVQGEYKAWRDAYVSLDRILGELARTQSEERKAQLFGEYQTAYFQMVPVSNTMGATFTEMAENGLSHTNIAIEENLVVAGILESTSLFVVVIALILAIILSFMLTRGITAPLKRVVGALDLIALGELDQDALVVKGGDETAILSQSYNTMLESLQYKSEILSRVAAGDLTMEVKTASDKDRLGLSLQKMVLSLNEILGQVDQAVIQMASGADQVSTASQDLSQGATEQASSLEEISASANEVGGQSQQNSENAIQAAQLAKKQTEDARSGNALMEELLIVMSQISESSEKTKKIVKTIDDIAFQVNLLALNANVEAARAGKYGRGFAVVAEEVRTLAVRSAQASKETTDMVDESQNRVELGNEKAKITGAQLKEMVEASVKVSDILDEIAHASKEQALAINQINKGLEQIDQVTQSNTASAEESASASEELASQAEHLKKMLRRFSLKNTETRALPGPDSSYAHPQRTVREIKETKSPEQKNSPRQNTSGPKTGKIVLDGDFEDF